MVANEEMYLGYVSNSCLVLALYASHIGFKNTLLSLCNGEVEILPRYRDKLSPRAPMLLYYGTI